MCRSRTALSQTEDMITAWALGPHTTVTLRTERVRLTPTSGHARMIVPTGDSATDSEDPSQVGHMHGKTCALRPLRHRRGAGRGARCPSADRKTCPYESQPLFPCLCGRSPPCRHGHGGPRHPSGGRLRHVLGVHPPCPDPPAVRPSGPSSASPRAERSSVWPPRPRRPWRPRPRAAASHPAGPEHPVPSTRSSRAAASRARPPRPTRAPTHTGTPGTACGYRVLIDGRELPVMQHGKSGWSSTINHYERFATPLEAARTAVISLKGAVVVPFDPTA